MFEKEAEEYAEKNAYQYANDFITCQEAFQKGAEFGYNKAREEIDILKIIGMKKKGKIKISLKNEWWV